MTTYIVTQVPKPAYRIGHVILVCIVEAESSKEAIAKAKFEPDREYNNPRAREVQFGVELRL